VRAYLDSGVRWLAGEQVCFGLDKTEPEREELLRHTAQ
jgi:hypothetical protein